MDNPREPLPGDVSSEAGSSHTHDRRSSQRYSYTSTRDPSSLTPATYASDDVADEASSPHGSETPDWEDDGSSSWNASATAFSRDAMEEDTSHASTSSVLHGAQGRSTSPTRSESSFGHLAPPSYTFPPPAPPHYPQTGWGGTEDDRLSPRRSHRVRELPRPLGGHRSGEEGYEGRYDLPPLSRPHEYQTGTRSGYLPRIYGEESRQVQGPSHHVYEDPRLLRPPPRYPDSHYGGYFTASTPGREDWITGPPSSSKVIPGPGRDVASTSKVVLPPVSQLLDTLGTRGVQDFEAPVLPRLRLPDQPREFRSPMGPDRDQPEGRGSPEATALPGNMKTKAREKKRQPEDAREMDEYTGEDTKPKVARKIYVACDFCRGRKLRCDGTKPSCSNCATRSLACKYQDHPRRRGPGKAPKGSREKTERKGAGKKTSKSTKATESGTGGAGSGSLAGFDPALVMGEGGGGHSGHPGPQSEHGSGGYAVWPGMSPMHHVREPEPAGFYQFSVGPEEDVLPGTSSASRGDDAGQRPRRTERSKRDGTPTTTTTTRRRKRGDEP
ncbi:hypothetical protein ID866_1443 [Astraeus odoratus]|nr:hypothetical protein ID866_1443 [Astraeus odoratus]